MPCVNSNSATHFYCSTCDSFAGKFRGDSSIRQHILSIGHINHMETRCNSAGSILNHFSSDPKKNAFFKRVVSVLLDAGIPINKLSNDSFRELLCDDCPRGKIPSLTTLYNAIPEL